MKLLVILLALVGLCVCVANSHHHQGQCNDVQQQWSATFDDDDDHTALEQFARAFLTKYVTKASRFECSTKRRLSTEFRSNSASNLTVLSFIAPDAWAAPP